MSLWEPILNNRYVDFNKLYSIQGGWAADEETIHESGRFKFVFNQIEAKGSIYDQGGWISTFDSYSDAVLFVYPHCDTELQAYKWHIQKLFSNHASFRHQGIIQFDQKFRKELAGDTQLTFNDVESSQSLLFRSFDLVDSSGKFRGKRSDSEICRWFNSGTPHINC